ncbi:unnamed protein product [Closterium sp. NIES-54]
MPRGPHSPPLPIPPAFPNPTTARVCACINLLLTTPPVSVFRFAVACHFFTSPVASSLRLSLLHFACRFFTSPRHRDIPEACDRTSSFFSPRSAPFTSLFLRAPLASRPRHESFRRPPPLAPTRLSPPLAPLPRLRVRVSAILAINRRVAMPIVSPPGSVSPSLLPHLPPLAASLAQLPPLRRAARCPLHPPPLPIPPLLPVPTLLPILPLLPILLLPIPPLLPIPHQAAAAGAGAAAPGGGEGAAGGSPAGAGLAERVVAFQRAFWKFLRPHTIRGTVLGTS